MSVKELDQEALLEAVATIETLAEELKSVQEELDTVKRAKADEVTDEEEEVKSAKRALNLAIKGFHGDVVKGGQMKIKAAGDKWDLTANGIVRDWNKSIVERILLSSTLLSHIGVETAAGRDYAKKVSKGGTVASWTGEYNSTVPVLVDVTATTGELTASPMINKNVAADAFFDVYSFIETQALARMANQAAIAILNGDGTNKPKGLLKFFDKTEGVKDLDTRAVDMFPVIIGAGMDPDKLESDLRKAMLTVPFQYHGGARWAMSYDAYMRIHAVRDTMERGLLQPDPTNAMNFTLFGFPVVIDPLLPADAPVIFGNFAEGFSVVSLPNTLDIVVNPYRTPGNVSYDITQRVGAITGANDALVGVYLPAATALAAK